MFALIGFIVVAAGAAWLYMSEHEKAVAFRAWIRDKFKNGE